MISRGSIIKYIGKTMCSLSVVEEVEPPYLWCKATMCKVRDKEWADMKTIDPEHNAERIDLVTLIDEKDFELILEKKIIPKKLLVNVEVERECEVSILSLRI